MEGIGSIQAGLLSHINLPSVCTRYWEHLCHSADTLVYRNPGYQDCEGMPLLSIKPTAAGLRLKIYPNPATGGEVYISEVPVRENISVDLLDLTGQHLGTYTLPLSTNRLTLPARQAAFILVFRDRNGQVIRTHKQLHL